MNKVSYPLKTDFDFKDELLKINNSLPKKITKCNLISDILKSEALETTFFKRNSEDLLNQFNPSTCTWAITIYENIFNIKPNDSKSIEERRSFVLAKMKEYSTTTKEVIKQVARAYFNTDKIEVTENYKEYEFTIIIDWNGDSKFGDLEQSIEEIKPAHLNFKFALNKSENININTDFKAYEFKLNMCGTFNCGTIPTFSNEGITLNEGLNINSNNQNWVQKYKMCGGNGIDN